MWVLLRDQPQLLSTHSTVPARRSGYQNAIAVRYAPLMVPSIASCVVSARDWPDSSCVYNTLPS